MRSETEIKLDDLLELLSKAHFKKQRKKIERIRPKIIEAMVKFQKEQGEKKK